jgi:hypothetical protein
VSQEKSEWLLRDIEWAESLSKLSEKLKIGNYENKTEIGNAREEARRISNGLARIINKRIRNYKRRDFSKIMYLYEEEGWKSSKKFFDKILKVKVQKQNLH